jgi:uncharacterized membrane protein
MNQAHLHLLINHLPIFGSFLGAVVLTYGLYVKSIETKIASYILFVISAIGAITAYLTGEGAEEIVENLQGVTENAIKLHEESALYSLTALIVLAVASIVSFVMIKIVNASKSIDGIILMISVVSFGLIAWTSHLGGQIRHTEIRANNPTQTQSEIIYDND